MWCPSTLQTPDGPHVFIWLNLDEHSQKDSAKSGRSWYHTTSLCWWYRAAGVKELWKLLDISYDKFILVPDDYHEKQCLSLNACRSMAFTCEYSGWYSVSDEEFFTESQSQWKFSVTKLWMTGGIVYQVTRGWVGILRRVLLPSANTKTAWCKFFFKITSWLHHSRWSPNEMLQLHWARP